MGYTAKGLIYPLVFSLSCATVNAGHGDQDHDDDLLTLINLMETNISTKTDLQDPDTAPGLVTVLKGEELRARGYLRVRDAFTHAAGLNMGRDVRGGHLPTARGIGGITTGSSGKVKVLVNGIEDRSDNSTRFLVVGRELLTPSGDDKTTILVSTSGTAGGAGVLHHLLQPLADHEVVMTFIESRPSRRKNWDYVFFIDMEGHASESPVSDALAVLEKESSLFRILGAYPKAVG